MQTTATLASRKSGWFWPLIWAALTIAFLSGLKLTPQWTAINGYTFDQISTLKPIRPDEPGIVIVAIDDPSFGELNMQWPWPRATHAKLLTALRRAGAKAVAFDIVLSDPSSFGADDDKALAAAARDDTVFATDLAFIQSEHADTYIRNEPLAILMAGGAKTGVANVQPDGDGVVRTLPQTDDNFMRVLLQTAGYDLTTKQSPNNLIQYFGPHNSYPRVSYYQALDPDNFLPKDTFKNKVVLVGYSLQAAPDVQARDAFETPYTVKTGYFTSGVEVQATIYDNFRTGLAITKPPLWIGFILIMFGGLLGLLAAKQNKPAMRMLGAVTALLLIVLFGWLALRYGRVWLSPWDMGASMLAVVGVLSARDFALERKMRGEIQGAFSQYLSPAMVKKIIADPSQLNLGGERRTLTIMFADIRGFTGLSENFKDDPQGLTKLINDILTPLADIVLANGGTIDKFIGDCIMAFWNAPLDDPDHAQNALKAAREMIEALPSINADIASQISSLKDVSIRIGIGLNSGDCVVGNMGSKTRFDYSVLGDPVNVAARLEGLSKTYKTSIVFGEETYGALRERSGIQELDNVQVRGREKNLTIYTVQ